MKILSKYIPIHFLLMLIVGILIQFYTKFWHYGFLKLGILFGFLLGILWLFLKLKKKVLFSITTLLVWFCIGVSTTYINNETSYRDHYKNYLQQDFRAILKIQKVLKPGIYYDKYQATVIQINETKTIGKILLNVKKDTAQNILKVDDKIYTNPTIKEVLPPLNFHQFNYKNYLVKQGIYNQVFTEYHTLKIVENNEVSLFGFSENIRKTIQVSLNKDGFVGDELGVINALLLGQRQDISKELINNYADAGAIHILAVSGLHIGIILLLLSWLLKPVEYFKKGKEIKVLLIVILLWFFAFIASLSASVVRAVTMFTFIAIGSLSNRKNNIYFSLITSMFFLLLIKPMFLFDVGFQLSYLAVFGIVWLQPKLYTLWMPKFKLVDKLWQLITVSIAAQVGVLPISLYYFHQFPSLFILSNIVIIPFLGLILFGGILVIILALLSILPKFIAEFYSGIISIMNQFVSWIAEQEGFLWREISMSFFLMISWYVLIISGVSYLGKKSFKRTVVFSISIALLFAVLIVEKTIKNSRNQFVVFHKNRKSIIGKRVGEQLLVYHTLDSLEIQNQKLLTSYKIGEHVKTVYHTTYPLIFNQNGKHILVIDSLGVYNIKGLIKPIVILQNSPKINLKRMIAQLNPEQIIADGSNYKSYVKRWKLTSLSENISFHNTKTTGAISINK